MDKASKQAFPVATSMFAIPGMTLREYYAGAALSGLLSSAMYNPKYIANHAVECADALLEILEKEEDKHGE